MGWRVLVLLLGGRAAHAAMPADIDPARLLEGDDPAASADAWTVVLQELGTILSQGPTAPAGTLGFDGTRVQLVHGVALVEGAGDDGSPSPWSLVRADGEAPAVLQVPRLDIDKGLPMSLEVGVSLGWLAGSGQGVVGGRLRAAPLEGYPPLPALSFQVGYMGLFGTDALDVGTMDVGATLGYPLPLGSIPGMNSAVFRPYASGGLLMVRARPRLPGQEDLAELMGVVEVDGIRRASDPYDPRYRFWQVGGGFLLQAGGFVLDLSARVAPGVLPEALVGMGYAF